MEMLLFNIGGDTYGVELSDVDEVLHMPTLRPIPSAPSFLAGVLNLRGELVPVIDLVERLGQMRVPPPPPISSREQAQSPYPKGTRLLLTESGDGFRYAVIMDGWKGIHSFEEESYREGVLTRDGKLPWINGINLGESGMVQRILLRSLLRDEERALLQNQV